MKKLMCLLVLVAFLGSMSLATGCGGSSGGIGAILGGLAIVLIISASGGSGAAAFAANSRVSIRPAIAISAPKIVISPVKADGSIDAAVDKFEITVTDLVKNTSSGDAVYTTTKKLDTLTGYNQYLVELFDGDVLLVKGYKYVHEAQKTGVDLNTAINPTTTAKALVFDKWKNGTNRTSYADFEYISTNSAFPTAAVEGELNNHPGTNVDYNNVDVSALVTTLEGSTIPGKVVVVNPLDEIYMNHEIYLENKYFGPATSTYIGLSYFSVERMVNSHPVPDYRLGNFFHFYNKNEMPISEGGDINTVVAFAGNGINLDAANTALATTWYTNSYQAKTEAGEDPPTLQPNDVFYFRVQKEGNTWMYGAIKVTTSGEHLKYHYKYNRVYGDYNLTQQ